jgi:hypothetical protein
MRRDMRFKSNFIHEVDETVGMAELGSVMITFSELLKAANTGGKKFQLVNQNVHLSEKALCGDVCRDPRW